MFLGTLGVLLLAAAIVARRSKRKMREDRIEGSAVTIRSIRQR